MKVYFSELIPEEIKLLTTNKEIEIYKDLTKQINKDYRSVGLDKYCKKIIPLNEFFYSVITEVEDDLLKMKILGHLAFQIEKLKRP